MRHHGFGSGATLALAALFGTTAACGEAGPTDLQTVRAEHGLAAPMAAGASVTRGLAQKSSGTLWPLGPCDAGVALAAEGTGVGTHVGRFDLSLTWCMDPATGEISGAAGTVVAASGHRIEMTGTGQALSPTELAFGLDIVGGTGRFQSASGRLDVTAVVGAAGGWTSRGTGWITY